MSKHRILSDTTIKILSVVIAAMLWSYVITEQNPVVPKEITIPVRIINMETLNKNDLVMIQSPESFNLELKLKGKKELLDAVNQNTLNAYADISSYTTSGEKVVPVIINGLPDGVAITSKSDQSIRVSLDKKIVVQKAVTWNITGNPLNGLASLAPVLTPTDVVLTGAESIINQVKTVRVDIDIAGANANISKRLPVRLLDEAGKDVTGIKLDTDLVNVTVPVSNTKRVPIQLVLEGTPGEGYIIADKFVQPKEILITGEQEVLDSIQVINTSNLNVNNLMEDVMLPVMLNLPEGIQIVNQNESVNATIDIQRLVTNTIDISGIQIRNLSEKYIVNDAPSRSVRVTLRGPEDLVNNAQNNITLYVDLTNAREGLSSYEVLWDKSPMLEILDISTKHIGLDIKSRE